MKRVKCPKCDNYIVFDETKYSHGQALVFKCLQCKKEFAIRIGASVINDIHEEKKINEHQFDRELGSVVVVENMFAFKQIFPLKMGDNQFGRYLKGTKINQPIMTSDPSVDNLHCIINVKEKKNGDILFTLRDAPSNTGTFCMNALLKPNERRIIQDGDIINIGATTMIFHAPEKSNLNDIANNLYND